MLAVRCAGLLALFSLLVCGAHAQQTAIPQAMVFTAATTARDAGGQDWAFMVWEAPAADLLGGKAFAVYSKSGPAAAVASFAREAIIQGRLDSGSLAPLLQSASLIGQDLVQFDKIIDGIYAGAFYPATAPELPSDRAQRTAVALSKAHTSSSMIGNLRQLSMMNPTLALCLGQAWAGPMTTGATKTYELREWNLATASDGAVVGRVTLTGGAPVILPAAARPVQVPDASEAADLSVRLRWGVPDELKRRIILHQGYRVWRMSWAQAHALGYDTTPPTLAQLQAHIAANQVKLVTLQPLFLPSPMSQAQADDLHFDPTRSYATDDNQRLSDPANYVAPADGAEMAYIVTPRDLLGRNGLPSLAGRGQFMLNRRPPVPRRAAVDVVYGDANDDGVQPQSFRFTFDENANDAANPTSGYEIYRGTGDILGPNGEPLGTNFLGLLQHTGAGAREAVDATPPFTTGVQVWFIVRALRAGAAGLIRSDFSAPVYASLQDHRPPAAPTPVAAGSLCPQPGVIVSPDSGIVNGEPLDANRFFHFRMVCDRLDQQMQWVDFSYVTDAGGQNQQTHTLERMDFGGGDRVQMEFLLTDVDISRVTRFACTTSDSDDGGHTATVSMERAAKVMNLDQLYEVRFVASMINPTSLDAANPVTEHFLDRLGTVSADSVEILSGASKGVAHVANVGLAPGYLVERGGGLVWVSAGFGAKQDGTHIAFTDHTAGGPDSVPGHYRFVPLTNLQPCDETRTSIVAATAKGKAASVRVCLLAPPQNTALEYRIYRRVDDGPLVLVAEGRPSSNAATICEEDYGLSVHGGTATYYGQFVGGNGAGSPLALVKRVRISPATLSRPVQATPVTAGDVDAPMVRLRWNCPTAGVDRFQITLKRLASSIVSSSVASKFQQVRKLRTPATSSLLMNFVPPEAITSIVTDRIGSTQLGEGPAFTLDVDVERNTSYEIWINAVSATKTTGPDSAVHTFEWKAPAVISDANVPWPFRAMPEVVSNVFPVANLKAPDKIWPEGTAQVGMQIGGFPLSMVGENPLYLVADGKALGVPFDNDTVTTRLRFGIERYIYAIPDLGNKTALPAVLYRQQLANAEWPNVSGDVIQVSPLISKILCTDDKAQDFAFDLRDPFFAVAKVRNPAFDNVIVGVGLYLLDTTPRAVGAKYRYWLVRFDPDTGSPVSVFPATLEEVTP